jgi:2-methylcitrate dehydratase PrpD
VTVSAGKPGAAAVSLARFAHELPAGAIPDAVMETAQLHLLDALGCGLAAHAVGVGGFARATVVEQRSQGPASAIGIPGGVPAQDAALVNGTYCHALDFDDTHAGAVIHVSVAVAPSALAAAERNGATGRELVAALVVGNEVALRLGMAAPSAFHVRGLHPTAICGIFGAVAAAARLDGLDAATTANALGIAGSMAAGLMEYLSDGSETKRLHPGWASHSAVLAARMAAHGATGPATVLEGRFGVYASLLGLTDVPLAEQVADLGERWETPRIAFKPYPACHYLHAAVDAAAAAARAGDVTADQIEEIVVVVPPVAVPVVLEPSEQKVAPRSEYEAKFSLQYSVAAMLVHGDLDVTSYTAGAIADPEVLRLAARVRYEARDFPTYPGSFPGGARITTRDGRTLEAQLDHQRGGAENPMSAEEVVRKFRTNALLSLPGDRVDDLQLAVSELASRPDVGFLHALRAAG